MAKQDWFRRETWTTEDELDFFAHLARARTAYNKAQYLRIQSLYLKDTRLPELLQPSIQLAEKCINEFSAESWQMASCHLVIAECHSMLGNVKDAVEAYLKCFDAQRKCPNHQTLGPTSFSMFVVEHEITDLYETVVSVLNEFRSLSRIQFVDYQDWGCLAIIASNTGLKDDAIELAKRALECAHRTHSGFNKHPTVGLVSDRESAFYQKVQKIANSQ
jgi:tetratricopeptide (TPR) repeat protein